MRLFSIRFGTNIVPTQHKIANHVLTICGLSFCGLRVLACACVDFESALNRQLQQGAFPACFMVATGVTAYNSFLRQARGYDGGSLDDFFPAFAAAIAASFLANKGSKMQAAA